MSSTHSWFGELAEVRDEVEPEPLSSPRERHSTDEDDEEQQVGECGGEIDHLQRGEKRSLAVSQATDCLKITF